MILVAPFLNYYTIDLRPSQCFLPHLLWAAAQLLGTVDWFILFGLLAQTYAVVAASGQTLDATLFLPFGTAFAEIGMVAYTRMVQKHPWLGASYLLQRHAWWCPRMRLQRHAV